MVLDKKPSHKNAKKRKKKLALNSGIQTYQILTNDDEVCIPSFSSILLAVKSVAASRRCSCALLLLLAVPPPLPRSVPWTRLLLVHTLLNFQVLSKTSSAEASDL